MCIRIPDRWECRATFIRSTSDVKRDVDLVLIELQALPMAKSSRPKGMKTEMEASLTVPAERLRRTHSRAFEAIQNGHNCFTAVVCSCCD